MDALLDLIKQADINAVTGKANGSKFITGFTKENKMVDGGNFSRRFGTGASSSTPYIDWWVVSIYYVIDEHKLVLGIERDRYSHINDIRVSKIRDVAIGNKQTSVVVYYESDINNVDYEELYECFISVSEEVMRLGLE